MANTVEEYLSVRNLANDLAARKSLWAELTKLQAYEDTDLQRTILLKAMEREESVITLDLNQATVKRNEEVLVRPVGGNPATVSSELSALSLDLVPNQTVSLGQAREGVFAVQAHRGGVSRMFFLFLRPVALLPDVLAVDLVEMRTTEPPGDGAQLLYEHRQVVEKFVLALKIRPKVLKRFFDDIPDDWVATNIVPWSTTALVCTGVFAGGAALAPCAGQVVGTTASFLIDVLKSAADELKSLDFLTADEHEQLKLIFDLLNTTAAVASSGVNPYKVLQKGDTKSRLCAASELMLPVLDLLVVRVEARTSTGKAVVLTFRLGIQETQKFVALMCTDFSRN